MIQPDIDPAAAALLPRVREAVSEAGAMIRAAFHGRGEASAQSGESPVDEQIEAMLKDRLLGLHACGFLDDETDAGRAAGSDAWAVHSRDGKGEFQAGRWGCALSVALLRAGHPVLGVVYAPLAPDDRGDLIAWAEGAELTRNGRPVREAPAGDPPTVAMNAAALGDARHAHETFPGIRVRAIPSPAHGLALAAIGEVDSAASLTATLAPREIAGGHALLIGAGRKLVELSGRPIDYGRSSLRGCIGGTSGAVAELVARSPRPGAPEPGRGALPGRHVADAARLERAQGCLLGQLAGDALGSAVEFQTADRIAGSHPDGVTRLADGGTWNLIAGQPTDDSEMALALARALVAEAGFDAGAVGRAYIRWLRSDPFDIGGTTRAGIAALAEGLRASSDSQANGALMRVSPIGIYAAGNPALAARLGAEDARLTHPHPVCKAASAACAAAISVGVAGGSAEEMWAAAEARASSGAQPVRERLHLARMEAPQEFQHQMGWVLTAFQNAFHHLLRGTPIAQALTETVARGGDTDTNAAICGALLGALQGRDAVPLQWRNAVLTCRPIDAAGIHHPRPPDYWPDDALELAEALLAAGAR